MAHKKRDEELGWKSWDEARKLRPTRLSGKDSLKPYVPL